MQHRQTISQTQLCALLWAALLAPAAELLPAVTLPWAGRGAWLTTLLAFPVLAGVGWLLARAVRGRDGLPQTLLAGFGPIAGRGILLLYMVWGEFLLALRLRLCAQRLLASGERDGSLWFYLPVAALLALWMARGKLAAFARAGQVLLAVVVTAAAVVLGLALFQVRPEHLLPLWWQDALPVAGGTLPVCGVLGWGMFAAFLLGQTEPAKHAHRDWLIWSGIGCLLLSLEQLVVIGNLGETLAQRLHSPFFALAKSVGVEGAFQRVESIVSALWIFGDLALLGVILFALWEMARTVWKKAEQKTVVTAAVLPAVIISMAAFPDGVGAEAAGRGIVLVGNLILGIALPVLGIGAAALARRRGYKGTSCGEKQKKGNIL